MSESKQSNPDDPATQPNPSDATPTTEEKHTDPNSTQTTDESTSKPPQMLRPISTDDISINLSTSNKKKKDKLKQTPSTPGVQSKNNKKKTKEETVKLKKGTRTKSPKLKTNAKRQQYKKHARERSRSDLSLAASKMREQQNKSKKNSTKSPKQKKQKTKDDTYLSKKTKAQSPKKNTKKKRSATMMPQPRTSSLRSPRTTTKDKQKDISRSSSANKRSKTPKIGRQRSKSLAPTKKDKKKSKTPKAHKGAMHFTIKTDTTTDVPIKEIKVSTPQPRSNKKSKPSYGGSKTPAPTKSKKKSNKTKQNKKNKPPPVISIADEKEQEQKTETVTLSGGAFPDTPGFDPPTLDTVMSQIEVGIEDKPVKITPKQNKASHKSGKSKKRNKDKFKKAEVRPKVNTNTDTKKKKKKKAKKQDSPVDTAVSDIDKRYGRIHTPKTPHKTAYWGKTQSNTKRDTKKKKNTMPRSSSNKKRESAMKSQDDAQQQLEYVKMKQMYRDIKKDLRKLKSDTKALEIERRAMKRDQGKLARDREQFEIDSRTFHLKKTNTSGAKKYGVMEEDKLRKMLYAERKLWNEERKNLRGEIMRLQGELGSQRLGSKHRMSQIKGDILRGLKVGMSHPHAQNTGRQSMKPNMYSRQQKELQRFIRIEKQKAMKDLDAEKKKLAMLARQLRADHSRMKKQRGLGPGYGKKGQYNRQRSHGRRGYMDKSIKKVYIDRKGKGRILQRNGSVVNYRPKETRIVYRTLRKKVVLRTHNVDTRIKYLRNKGKQLNIIKNKIVTLEGKIDRKRNKKRQNKKKYKKLEDKDAKKKKKKKGGKDSKDSKEQEIQRRKWVSVEDEALDELSDSEYDAEIDNVSSDDGDDDTVTVDDEEDGVVNADPELAQALEELANAFEEYYAVEQEIDETAEGFTHNQQIDFEEEKESVEQLPDVKEDGALEMDSLKVERDEEKSDDAFEEQLLNFEKQLSALADHEPDFDKQVSKMEHIVSEQAEEAGTLREVIDSLSERLASAQLEIDHLKEVIRAATRKQQLRQLYQKMAYSSSAPYKYLKSAEYNTHLNPKHHAQTSSMVSYHSPVQSNDNLQSNDIAIVDNDGNTIMDLYKAANIICDTENYSDSAITKAANALYAHGLMEDGADIISDKNIVAALLDVIQYKGKLAQPENVPVVEAAMKALVSLLPAKKARKQFFEKDGVNILDALFGSDTDDFCGHVQPVCGLIGDCCAKVVKHANDTDKETIHDIAVKMCRVAKAHLKDSELLHSFGGLLCEIDEKKQDTVLNALVEPGILDVTTSCALSNPLDRKGVSTAFGACYDHVADVEGFLYNNKNIGIDNLVDAVDSSAHALPNVLDGIVAMVSSDAKGKHLVAKLEDGGLEPVLMRAMDDIIKEYTTNNGNEENDDESKSLTLNHANINEDLKDNAAIQSIADFYNTLCFEKLDPKLSLLKTKLETLNIPIYGTKEWIQSLNPKHEELKRVNSPETKMLEDLYEESKYEFDENDAIQRVKDRRHKRVFHPTLNDIGGFLERINKARSEDFDDQQIGLMRRRAIEQKERETALKNKGNKSKMSQIFTGIFGKRASEKPNELTSKASLHSMSQSSMISPSSGLISGGHVPMPNRVQQQQRMFQQKKLDKNGRKRIPKYDDFMNEAFNNKIGRGLNEVQQVFNEMTHHTGMVKPIGSMLQKWYVLANHSSTYWVSQTNKELERYHQKHDGYYEMEDEEKFNDCWLLYDMQRTRLVQEIRWRNRGQMNDPKYITVQSTNHEETPWVDVSNAFLEKTENEQVINVNKKARYWRILFLGNYGEDTDDAPRFVFYEVQFWGRKHSTMNYSRAAMERRRKRSTRMSLGVNGGSLREQSVSHTYSTTFSTRPQLSPVDSVGSFSGFPRYKLGYDNARKGRKHGRASRGLSSASISGIEMTGKSKFATTPI